MPRLRVVLAAATVALVTFPLQAEEETLPGPTERIVRLAGEAGRLRQSIDTSLASTTTERAATDSEGESAHFQTQNGPQSLSWFSKGTWKFYAGLLLLTVAAAVIAWVL